MNIKEVSKTYNHIDLTEVKPHLNMSNSYTAEDLYLTGLIAVATEQAENYTEVPIALTSLEASTKGSYQAITLPYSNYKVIDSITVDGAALDPAGYKVVEGLTSFDIQFTNQLTGDILIAFKVGFDASNIKPVIKQAILVKIMDLFDTERSDYLISSYSRNNVFENMLHYYRRITFI
jgi:hypothetical protein